MHSAYYITSLFPPKTMSDFHKYLKSFTISGYLSSMNNQKKWKTRHDSIYDRLICIHAYLQAHNCTLYCNGTGAWFSNVKTAALTEMKKKCKLLICTKNEKKKLFYYMCCRIGHGMVFTELTQVTNPKNVAIE